MKGPPLADGVPPWTRERRQPTHKELAAKHVADGGFETYGAQAVGNSHPGNSLGDMAQTDKELVELEGMPGTFVRRPKAVSVPDIKLRSFDK